jgi:ribonuclease HII
MVTIFGADKAGRGPVIGHLVMCGVLVNEQDESKLRKIGVKDSKLLTPKQRESLYPKILKIIKDYKFIKIEPEEIDNAVDSEETNLNWLEAEKTAEIINMLKPDKAFVDCPSTNIPAYTNYLKNLLKVNTNLKCMHHGESKVIEIAAASVLAKIIRDQEIEKIKKQYKIEFGSGYPSDPNTKRFLKDNYDKYPKIIRKSWSTYKDLVEKNRQKTLSDF